MKMTAMLQVDLTVDQFHFVYAPVVGFHLFSNFFSVPLHYFDPGCVA
jgi:hypothetical protein